MPTYTLQGPNGQTVEVVANSEAEAIAKASGQSGPSGTAAPSTGRYNAGGMEVLGDGYYRNQQGTTYREGPRGGFSAVGGPSDGMVSAASNQAYAINSALRGVDRLDGLIAQSRATGPAAWINDPKNAALMDAAVTDLQLQLKEAYNLGVLNGPDLALMQEVTGSPTALRSAVLGGTLQPKLAQLSNILGNRYRDQETTFEGQGGRATVMAPMFQSDRSEYTPEEFSRDGTVPQAAFRRTQAAKTAPPPPNRMQAAAPFAASGIGGMTGRGLGAATNAFMPASATPAPPARPAAPASSGALPPAARAQLREGHVTTFGNGQSWTLRGGRAVKVN